MKSNYTRINEMISMGGGLLAGALLLNSLAATASERLFTYTYEPETMLQGATEFEQWVTLRTGRNSTVGQENFNRWDLRSELEYGVTDNYTVGLYLNLESKSFKDPATDETMSDFEFKGVSLENRYMLVNPAGNPVGLTFYVEGGYGGEEAFLEQKIILGQRHGDWKWAVNLIHETEWEDNLEETEGELGATAGLSRALSPNWSVGVETRNVNKWPNYSGFESSVVYVGPVVSYRQERWWATLSILPQVWGHNFNANPDGESGLDLAGNERINIRLLVGISL